MAAARLRAVCFPLGPGPPIDPFALAGSDGIVFRNGPLVRVGTGVALTLHLPGGLDSPAAVSGVTKELAAIALEDHRAGSGPARPESPATDSAPDGADGVVAFGSLPFDRSAPATLTVPAVVYGADPDGAEWVTLVGEGPLVGPSDPGTYRQWLLDRSAPLRSHGSPDAQDGTAPTPTRVHVTPRSSDDSFRSMVAEALAVIERGTLSKVVLARQVDVTMDRAVAVPELLRRWHDLEPNCAVFSVPTPEGRFLGASPELLVERAGRQLRSRPLAGTAGRSDLGPAVAGGLLASVKDGNEHRLVVEAIERTLAPLTHELDVPDRPSLVHLHTITHLGTTITGTLDTRDDGSVPSSLELVAALHPTPAVGGVPSDAALELIDRLEPQSRGHYAGPVGYVDAGGDGVWMVGIRSMTVREDSAVLAAGVGIVERSDPQRELEETDLKLTAVFDALAPGHHFSTAAPDRREAAG
jgi:isochorismate synthase